MCVCLLHSCAQTYSLRGLVFIPTCVCSLPVSDAQKKLGDPKIAEVLLSNPQEVHIGAHTRVWETENALIDCTTLASSIAYRVIT